MTPILEMALSYGSIGFHIFPCRTIDKKPFTAHGFRDATAHLGQIGAWWTRWPDALIGFWPGASDIAVLDVDVKDGKNGLATLSQLDALPPPVTPQVVTRSGGLHLYYRMPAPRISMTTGAEGRGIGVGLDWRGDGGYAILPSPGSGYEWGHWHHGNCRPIEVPATLLPREPAQPVRTEPIIPVTGLSVYAEAALDSACRNIIEAPAGQQEATLNRECFSIGTLAGAGGIPVELALDALQWAAGKMPDHDPRRPWRGDEIVRKVERSFTNGMAYPRETVSEEVPRGF